MLDLSIISDKSFTKQLFYLLKNIDCNSIFLDIDNNNPVVFGYFVDNGPEDGVNVKYIVKIECQTSFNANDNNFYYNVELFLNENDIQQKIKVSDNSKFETLEEVKEELDNIKEVIYI